MSLVERLSDPVFRSLITPALLAGLAVVGMCSVLSGIVVVKRLGFIGQGVSHSAFGGIGVAALLGAAGLTGSADTSAVLRFVIVVLFCIAAAIGMSLSANRRTLSIDTAIGLYLVGSMALGAILIQQARAMAERRGGSTLVQSWESILFGSILYSSTTDAIVAWLIGAAVVISVWLMRRPLMFWALDEQSARAFGVPTAAVRIAVMVLLALAVVVAMKLAGVVLATALLVVPGATALKISNRLWPVVAWSVATGVAGLVGGLTLSLWLDWQPGPSIVAVMTGLFVIGSAWERMGARGLAGRSTLPA